MEHLPVISHSHSHTAFCRGMPSMATVMQWDLALELGLAVHHGGDPD